MAEESAFYITSVAHGMVLARSPNGQPSGVVAQNRGDQDAPQKWLVERGSEPNIVALRCASTNDYLHANGGASWATVGTGAKQWWKVDAVNVTAPGACRLSPVEHTGVFLNHFQGIRVAKGQSMKVHMWQWEQPNQFCLTWYFFPADGSFGPNGAAPGAASEASNARIDELEAGKTEAEKKLKALEDNKMASEAKLKELQDRTREYDAKLAELEHGKTGSAATIAELQDKLARRDGELEAQKGALKKNVDDQKAADAQRAQDTAANHEAKTHKKEEKTQKKALKQEDKAHKKAAKHAEKAQTTPQKLEQTSRLPPTPPASPPQQKLTVPATKGVSNEVKNCKHVVLPPPRKIRRKVVGIVYAQ
ncbi:hypothetical protein PMIN06_005162 [Paraphaeosphaeria minitans]|uniref:Uncharacterized protein n=1 Tax=Paraphaeosphaeria minitans TaxID=565426 RepID=A0A9P6KPQ3_9PLEO|nr:hypothetical protein PMIN01_08349 [Paraphaeosphaeria minitans]